MAKITRPEVSERERQRAAFKLAAAFREKAEALTKSLYPDAAHKSVDLDMAVRVWADCFAAWTAGVSPQDADQMIIQMVGLMKASRAYYRKTHGLPPDPMIPQDFRVREVGKSEPLPNGDGDKKSLN